MGNACQPLMNYTRGMNSTVLAIRAVSSEFAMRVLWPLLFIGIGVYALVAAIIVWLAVAVSPWWLLLGVIPTILFCAALAVWIGVRIAAGRIAPGMTTDQKRLARKVVKRLASTAEQLGTPRFVLLFRVIKDIVFPPKTKQTLVGELTEIPGQLHREFDALRKTF